MSPTRLSNLAIVVVEDHNDTRRFLGIFLGDLGAKVVLAGNAIEGLAAVKTYHPNLVLSDISMPGRDGFGLLSDIRVLGPDGRHFGKTTFANVSGIRIVDLPADQ
jgi:CheY-like chemotaxis protein